MTKCRPYISLISISNNTNKFLYSAVPSHGAALGTGHYNNICVHQSPVLGLGYSMSMSMTMRRWYCTHLICISTGASHASHLGCPSAYSSRLSYIKKRQVCKSRSETDWPHLGIMPDFSTEKNRSILMLTSTCWQEISLSNTVELTTVSPQKQKICRFKRRFLPVFENSTGSIVCLRAANPVTRHDWVVLFLRTSAGCHTETGTYVKTKPPNCGASQDLLRIGRQWNLWNFRKPAKNDV